jgi:carboxylate-amine ligase
MGAENRFRRTPQDAGLEWCDWQPSPAYSVGMEEEIMLVDPRDWSLAQRIEDVLGSLPPEIGPYVGAETHQAAIELASDPHPTVGAVTGQLGELRLALARALRSLGLRAAAAGTHPTTLWTDTRVSPSSRYQLIHSTMRALARREPTFALHVHVGVPEPEAAIELMNRLRAHLPTLLALSANSPYWQGRDTGFASSRTLVFQAFPRTGLPRRFSSYSDWSSAVDRLLRAGAVPEPTFLWWDIRPQPRFGTVEVRIMDTQSTLDRVGALGALVQSVARLELEEGYVSSALICADEVLAENRFLAARDGVEATLIEPERAIQRPVREQVAELLEAARPHALALGCAEELEDVEMLMAAPAAEVQRHRGASDGMLGMVGCQAAEFEAVGVTR